MKDVCAQAVLMVLLISTKTSEFIKKVVLLN